MTYRAGLFTLTCVLVAASWAAGGEFFYRHRHRQDCSGQPGCECAACSPSCCLKPVKTDVKKPIYSDKCVPYCQSKGCLLCGLFCRQCDHVRYKKVLMKTDKVVEQKCELKCVLEDPCKAPPAAGPAFEQAPPPAPLPPRPTRAATGHPADKLE